MRLFGLLQPLPGDFQSNDGTSGYFRSPEVTDIISCCVTASYSEMVPCRMSNVQHTRVIGLLQPLPGDFRWNDVTFGHL